LVGVAKIEEKVKIAGEKSAAEGGCWVAEDRISMLVEYWHEKR
jgi:hypothetical protein